MDHLVPTPAYQGELAAGSDIPRVQEYAFHSQSLSDISPSQADVSYINPSSLPYPSVDCIPACRDTPVPDDILQRQVLPRPKPKPWLSKKDVPSQPNVPRPQPKPRLSLKRLVKYTLAQMPFVIKTHLHPPLPVEMYIVVPSVHPSSLTPT